MNNRREIITKIFEEFKEKHKLTASLSFELPKEFGGAFGMFDVTKNVLYVNINEKINFVRLIFSFFHELRHALQYNFPERFSGYIQKTLPYVVHFDGNCYMLRDKEWLHCQLKNDDFDFMEVYKNLPYEIDANNFAYQQSKMILKEDSMQELDGIYKNSIPKNEMEMRSILDICEEIKAKIEN